MIALQGDKGTQAELEIACSLDIPTVALLRNYERIGTYAPDRLPGGTVCVESLEEIFKTVRDLLRNARSISRLVRPPFDAISAVYSTDPASVHSCSISFPNTCAIRLSEALDKTVEAIKLKFAASRLNRCLYDFMRGAEDLAAVLRRADVFGVYDYGFSQPGAAPLEINGKKGIVAYINIRSFPGHGHIDLWDKASPVRSAYWDADPIWFWRLN